MLQSIGLFRLATVSSFPPRFNPLPFATNQAAAVDLIAPERLREPRVVAAVEALSGVRVFFIAGFEGVGREGGTKEDSIPETFSHGPQVTVHGPRFPRFSEYRMVPLKARVLSFSPEVSKFVP